MDLTCTIRDFQKLDFMVHKLTENTKFQFLILYKQQLIRCNSLKFTNEFSPNAPLSFSWGWKEVHERFLAAHPCNCYTGKISDILNYLKSQPHELLIRSTKLVDIIPDSFVINQLPMLYNVTFLDSKHETNCIFVSENDTIQILAIESMN